MPRFCGPVANDILSALPGEDYERLLSKFKPVTFSLGEVIHEAGEPLDFLYFPTSSVVSLVYTTRNGATAEIGVIGSDGMLGVERVLGGNAMPHRAVTQIAGAAVAIPAEVVLAELSWGTRLLQLLLRYTQALLTQISQTAVCNRMHAMEQRLVRWLLSCQDRTHSDELKMTQEFLSQMLGGRRESVTIAAGRLQDAGLIEYSRGHISIRNRNGLEEMSCECYRVVKDECVRLFRDSGRGIDPGAVRSNRRIL